MRDRYEKEQDVTNERAFADRLEAALPGLRLYKVPMTLRVDFLAQRGSKGVAWIEVKFRTCARTEYSTSVLHALKWWDGVSLSRATGLPFYLGVQWTDSAGLIRCDNKSGYKITMGGRTRDYRSEGDYAPVIEIPVSDFQVLTKNTRTL